MYQNQTAAIDAPQVTGSRNQAGRRVRFRVDGRENRMAVLLDLEADRNRSGKRAALRIDAQVDGAHSRRSDRAHDPMRQRLVERPSKVDAHRGHWGLRSFPSRPLLTISCQSSLVPGFASVAAAFAIQSDPSIVTTAPRRCRLGCQTPA